MSLRAATRITGCSINTVTKLLCDVGAACTEFSDKALRNLPSKRVQCDEIWAFVGAKQKNVPADRRLSFGIGDVWTYTALDADSKLMCAWAVGRREFISDLAERLANRVQLTTDGHKPYLNAVENAFGGDIDFAQLVKIYGNSSEGTRRYSPSEVINTEIRVINGKPDKAHVSTSYVERCNITMRMGMRRFTRLTNAFSTKVENHAFAIALHFTHYNFCRIHKTLRVTPAMQAGLTDHVWSLEEIAALVPAPEAKPRGPYKKNDNSN